MLKLTALTQVLAERKRWHQGKADDYFISKKTEKKDGRKGKSVIHAKVEKEKEEEVEDKGKDHE